ncbi:MAG: hypothetical protein ABSD74_02785 [Rhizomicrobium sp.]|jgi:hypothetical protein
MASLSLNAVKHLASDVPIAQPCAPLPTGGTLFVQHPSDEDLLRIYEMSQSEISRTVAPFDLVKAVYKHNPDTFWGVYFSADNTRESAKLIGYYSFLHLNDAGAIALENGTFDGLNLDFGHLVPAGMKPTVVYVWALVARKVARIATVLVAKALGRDRYGGVPIYGRAATLGGVASLKGYGFESIRPSEKGVGDLFRLDPEVPQTIPPGL